MTAEIYFALTHRIYRIRYPSGERLTLTLCSVWTRKFPSSVSFHWQRGDARPSARLPIT